MAIARGGSGVAARKHRPLVAVHVTWYEPRDGGLAPSQRDACMPLGRALHRFLSRGGGSDGAPVEGIGIPVRLGLHPDAISVDDADLTAVFVLVDRVSLLDGGFWGAPLAALRGRVEAAGGVFIPVVLPPGHVALLPSLAGINVVRLSGTLPPEQDLIGVATVELYRLLDESRPQRAPRLFLSHAKRDLDGTGHAVEVLRNHFHARTHADTFFDVHELAPGRSLDTQLEDGLRDAVFVVFQSDAYSSREWCRKEVLWAKRLLCPSVIVSVLREGEPRSFAYLGNAPVVPWDAAHPERVADRAFQEALRSTWFLRHARHVAATFGVAVEHAVVPRPPELLDCVNERLGRADAPCVVIHPDPPLSPPEQAVLRAARPKWRFVTPTALAGAFLSDDATPPLAGLTLGLSLSAPVDEELRAVGMVREDVDDAVAALISHCLVGGASVAYGGDFRQSGYTRGLADLIRAYNLSVGADALAKADATGAARAYQRLRCYLTETSFALFDGAALSEVADAVGFERVAAPPDVAGKPRAPDGDVLARVAQIRDLHAMRQHMQRQIHARLLVAGQLAFRGAASGQGFKGLLPGVVEEAWFAFAAGCPVFPMGAFGGATRALVDALLGDGAALREERWIADGDRPFHAALRARLDELAPGAEVPRSAAAVADQLAAWGRPLREGAATDTWTNGLTVEENRRLFATRHVPEMVSLILAGLRRLARRNATPDRLAVNLLAGSLAEAQAEAYLFPVVEGVDVQGAGRALDEQLAGAIRRELDARRLGGEHGGVKLIPVGGGQLPGNFVLALGLGRLDAVTADAVTAAVAEGVRRASALGQRHLASALIGTSCGLDEAHALDALVAGVCRANAESPSQVSLTLAEIDRARAFRLVDLLQRDRRVALNVLPAPAPTAAPAATELRLHVDVRRRDDGRHLVSVLPPHGRATALSEVAPGEPAEIDAIVDECSRGIPPPDARAVGRRLADALFSDNVRGVLAAHRDVPLVVVHDAASSRLPFETLQLDEEALARARGVTRTVLLRDMQAARWLETRTTGAALRVLLVANPTGDLPGAEAEAAAIAAALDGRLAVTTLLRDAATADEVVAALAGGAFDVLHYAGHCAFARAPAPSGLRLADRWLVASDLAPLSRMPSLVFANACEAGRLERGDPALAAARAPFTADHTVGIAEAFLRAGVANYLGTYWLLDDGKGAAFAAALYRALVAGSPLGDAVRAGRAAIAASIDWPSYLLFGDPGFRLRLPGFGPAPGA